MIMKQKQRVVSIVCLGRWAVGQVYPPIQTTRFGYTLTLRKIPKYPEIRVSNRSHFDPKSGKSSPFATNLISGFQKPNQFHVMQSSFSSIIPFLLLLFCLIGSQAADDLPEKSSGEVCSGGSNPGECPINCFRPDPVCGADGVTYWCGCPDAACHGARVVKTGACDAGNAGSASLPGQALLLIHIVWLFLLGLSLLFGAF